VTRGMVYLLIVVANSMYHICNSFHGVSPTVCRSGDFFFAQLDRLMALLLIPLTALFLLTYGGNNVPGPQFNHQQALNAS
jgi:hypothetical protein